MMDQSEAAVADIRNSEQMKPGWSAKAALEWAAGLWFVVALIGQWAFVVHIVGFYGMATLRGDYAKWGKFLTHGFIAGDKIGNLALVTHITVAAIITACGPLQLIPQIRSRWPSFHRWNGRTYAVIAFAGSISALYMLWVRNERVPGDLLQHLGISLDAALILFCAIMAVYFARARQFAIHRRWATRLFLVVSGVWFFRVGVFFWLLVNHGPVGFDPKTFQGPFLDILSFAESLLPLLVFELYLWAQRAGNRAGRLAVAGLLLIASVVTAIGVFAVTMMAWLPNL